MSDLLTTEQQAKIEALVQQMELTRGVGTEESACSVAAINLALTGELTDKIPDCMSEVTGKWIIGIQDRMPSEMRNSSEWKRLLPLAAGTGRTKESERLSIIMDWMWESLKLIQPFADAKGFGEKWAAMCVEKSHAAACAAIATAAYAADYAATYAADAATYAANAAAQAAANAAAWQTINPLALLEKLINV